jgi:hypothetical protein
VTDTTLQQAAPAPNSGRKLAFRIFLWVLVLAFLGAAWFLLLASVAPARLNFSSVGAVLMASAPPMLLTLICWTGAQRFSTPDTPPPAPLSVDVPVAPSEPPVPVARFRIGAWSALTPHGNAIETVDGTKARTKVFKPDQAIRHPSGYPAHASMIATLKLEAMGHAAGTRLRAPRVMTMLGAILDDLHGQQSTLVESIEGPASVYWLVPPELVSDDGAHSAIFAGAWKRSAWRDGAYLLHMIPAGGASVYSTLSVLQAGIDQASIPYAIIIAADSLLDGEELAPALALGHVFSHTAPDGFIPAEGAGGILLFNPVLTSDDLWANAAVMGPVKVAGTDHDGLRDVMSAALTVSGKGADDIGVVVSDSDHRSRGIMEIIGAMTHVLGALDPLEQRISPMEYAGAFGAASDLVHLALAVELAGDKSVLTIGTSGGQYASVVVIPA